MLADETVTASLISASNIGLYQHANGNAAMTPSQRAALWAAWGLSGGGESRTVGEIGGFISIDPVYLGYFGGRYPDQVNMNVVTGSGDGSGSYTASSSDRQPGRSYAGFTSASDLATMELAIAAARRAGAVNVAIFMTPNGGGEDLDDQFVTGGYWANIRAAALQGGGIALDVPPTYWVQRGALYRALVAQMIKWANAQHIRSSLTVSPYAAKPDHNGNLGGCGYDAAFFDNTKLLFAALRDAQALPSQWVVERYGLAAAHCGTENDIETEITPNSLNGVTLFLSRAVRALRR